MTRGLLYTFITTLLIVSLIPSVSHGEMKPSGYFRSFLMYSKEPVSDTDSTTFQTRLRLKLSGNFIENTHSELAYELGPLWRDKTTFNSNTQTYQGFTYRAYDLEGILYPSDPG